MEKKSFDIFASTRLFSIDHFLNDTSAATAAAAAAAAAAATSAAAAAAAAAATPVIPTSIVFLIDWADKQFWFLLNEIGGSGWTLPEDPGGQGFDAWRWKVN